MPRNALHLIQLTLIPLIWLCIAPLLLFWLYLIYKKWNTMILEKRYIGLTLVSCIFCLVWICIGVPLHILQDNAYIVSMLRLPPEPQLQVGFSVAVSILFPMLNFPLFCVLLIRFFMVYFHLNWTQITLATHWIVHVRKPSSKDRERERLQQQQQQKQQQAQQKQQQLAANNSHNHLSPQHKRYNDKKQEEKKASAHDEEQKYELHETVKGAAQAMDSWFVKERCKWGSAKRVLRQIYLVYVCDMIAAIFVGVMAAYNSHNKQSFWPIAGEIVTFLLWLLSCCPIVFFWARTPRIHHLKDAFFFREEMEKLFRVLCVVLTLRGLLFCASMLWRAVDGLDSEAMAVSLRLCNEVYVIFTCSAVCYVQTRWVLTRIQKEADSLQCDSAIFYNTAPKKLLRLPSTQKSSTPYTTTRSNSVQNVYPPSINLNHHELPKITENVIQLTNVSANSTISGDHDSPQTMQRHNQHHSNSSENDSSAIGADTPSNQAIPTLAVAQQQAQQQQHAEQKQEAAAVAQAEPDEFEGQMYRILFITLEQEKLLDALTQYLAAELSMECIFAFIEFTQYKRLLERDQAFMQSVVCPTVSSPEHDALPLSARYSNNTAGSSSVSGSAASAASTMSTASTYSFTNIKLPKSISKSSIVHNRKYARYPGTDRYRRVAKKLSEKYLESGAEFELCINHETKYEAANWVKTYCRHFKPLPRGHGERSIGSSNWSSQSEHSSIYSSKICINDELYHLFEQCRKEIYFLMAHSGDRYIKYAERAKRN